MAASAVPVAVTTSTNFSPGPEAGGYWVSSNRGDGTVSLSSPASIGVGAGAP
jgi:hypothetical protein